MDYVTWFWKFQESLWLVYGMTTYDLFGKVSVEQLFDEKYPPFGAAIEANTRFLAVTQHVATLDAENA